MWIAWSPGGRSRRSSWITMPSLSYMSAEPTLLPFASFSSTVTLAVLGNDRAKSVRVSPARKDWGVFMAGIIVPHSSSSGLYVAFAQNGRARNLGYMLANLSNHGPSWDPSQQL